MKTAALARYQQGRWVTVVGAVLNIVLAFIKLFFGIIGHSSALVADSINSFSDLLIDGLVLLAMRYGSQDADEEHPYGHGRIETAATMFFAVFLAMVGGGIAYQGLLSTLEPSAVSPAWYTLVVVFVNIFLKEGLFHYTRYIGKKVNSDLLMANAWHHRSDAASAFVVLLGIAGAMMGFTYMDAVAALIVGLLIVRMAWQLGKSSLYELIDTGVNDEFLRQIRAAITRVPGVVALHQLRTRRMGSHIFLDTHVLVSPKISVSEGHHISLQVQGELSQFFPSIHDITVHIDPEDDEVAAPCIHLPTREALLPQLMHAWQANPELPRVRHVVLHYLDGKIELDLRVEANGAEVARLADTYLAAIKDQPDVARVRVALVLE
jgi:cation diffusion facilitator family transporter